MSNATKSSGSLSPQHKRHWFDSVELWLKLLTAMLALAVPILAIYAASQNQQKEEARTTLTNQDAAISSLGASNDSLQDENATLQQSVSALQSELSTASGPAVTVTSTVTAPANETGAAAVAATTSSPASIAEPAIRHEGPLVVTARDGFSNAADLDAPAGDPEWGRSDATGDGRSEGPGINGPSLFGFTGSEWVFLGKEEANWAVCSQSQVYESLGTEIGELDAGVSICARTTAGRFALLTVAKEANAQQVEFNVKVWEKA